MRVTLLTLSLFALTSCSVGPEFHLPSSGLPEHWSIPQDADASSQPIIEAQWWQEFGDPLLSSLVEQAAKSNLDSQVATNRISQSRALLEVTGSQQYPGVSTSGGYQRDRSSQNGLVDPSNLGGRSPYEVLTASLDASWELDLWGRVRKSVEAAEADVRLTAAQRDGLLLSIAAETATDYIRLRGVQAKIQVADQNLEIAQQSARLTQVRFENGVTTNLDTANSAAEVASIEATLPVLRAQEDGLINAISYMLGKPPRTLSSELKRLKGIPYPSPDVPMGIPSDLAKRRPDIQQSEAALRRATAAIGIAEADFYPRVSLGASAGFQSLNGSDFGAWESRQWSYGPSLYLPIFQGGRLTGTLELRKRQEQEAALNYRRIVLGAWHEIDNALIDYAAEKKHHLALAEAVRQNNQALNAARERYNQGAIDFINVLTVQRALLTTESELVDSTTSAALQRVRLYKALGGGWPSP